MAENKKVYKKNFPALRLIGKDIPMWTVDR
ncbi:MAG: hypothetical protein K0R34_2355 [Herbinix sp.]|jgi:hypothetical protein|nr:hypothetical protein [Herbinix sp.]